jgi:hypothetical protein
MPQRRRGLLRFFRATHANQSGPMKQPELTFVIPTYRLRDVAETVERYHKDKKEFPQIKVKNKKVKEHKGIAA